MPDPDDARLEKLLSLLFKAHPWHGISPGPDVPDKVVAFIEIVPTDTVKYELDKYSGELKLDRPQRYSSLCPSLYGLIPQTYCGEQVGARCAERTGLVGIEGDGDPMDICVLSERAFTHASFLLKAHPIGGLRMVDGNQADDKIVAVLEGDLAYGTMRELGDVPRPSSSGCATTSSPTSRFRATPRERFPFPKFTTARKPAKSSVEARPTTTRISVSRHPASRSSAPC